MRWIDVWIWGMAYSRLMRLVAMTATRVGRIEIRASDVLLAAGLSTWAVIGFVAASVGSLVPLLAMTLPLAWRRSLPLITFGVVGAGFLGLVYETQPGIRPYGPVALASLLIATYSLATYAAHRIAAVAAVAAVAAIAVVAAARAQNPTLPLPSWLIPPLILGGVWLAAGLLRERAEREARTAEIARRLQREQRTRASARPAVRT